MITLIIVDDHKIFREGLKSLIETQSDELKILGEASNGSSAIALINKTKPDVAILDFAMPDMDGLDVLKIIKQKHTNLKTIMLTAHYDPVIFNGSMDLGADGFLLKKDSFDDILGAVKAVIANKKFISRTVIKNSTNNMIIEKLTNREVEIFKLLAKGLTINDISKRFQISIKTVDTHKYNIMNKLDIHTSVDIVRIGYKLGLHNEI
jgi:two-component system invasion response regulator UvrY